MTEQEILNSLLKKAGVSLTKASKLSNIPQPRFSEWLSGKRTPKWSTLNKIAECLNTKIVTLIEDRGSL